MLPQAATDYYRQQQRLTLATVAATRRAWSQMGPDFDASWIRVLPRLELVVSAAQLAAARAAAGYFSAVLAETGQIDAPVAALRAPLLVGVAPDGRTLDGLLRGAVIDAKRAMRALPVDEALAQGGRWLDGAVHSTIADTARNASAIQLAVRPNIGGYTRMVSAGACQRCRTLGGRFFRWNQGFQRHNRCSCRHVPASRDIADELITTPANSTVVSGVTTTSAAVTGARRMTPERILEQAPTRDAAIEMLRRYGFAA